MGSIERRNGMWRVRYRDPIGRNRSRTFQLKADGERFLREQRVDADRGQWIDPRGAELSLKAWSEEFLSLARGLAPTTQDTYRRDIDLYIVPRFGSYRIGRLPADEIEKWLLDEVDAGLATSSVHRHYRLLRRMLQVAVEKEKLLANPCDRVHPPRIVQREMTFLTWQQAITLAEAMKPRFSALIYLALDSGMRWSELAGLRRSKLDLNRGKVRVTEQLVRLDNGEWLRKEPKTTSSRRTISLSPFTTNVLASHVEQFSGTGPDALVFPNGAGNPLQPSSFLVHFFQPAQRAAGVKCRFHDLRHTSVALAIAEGAHPKAIQVRMGHSSISVTLDRYGHLFPELDEAIASSFDARLTEARAKVVPLTGEVGGRGRRQSERAERADLCDSA